MDVICIEEEAFYVLIEKVVARLKDNQTEPPKKEWLNTLEAMTLLGIKSKTTLQKMRDTGNIRFSQPMKKIILYDRVSIEDYLERSAQNTF